MKKGFTLVETLVSVGILSLLSIGVATIVFLTVQSSDKTTRLKEVKQSGEAATMTIQEFIRNSESLVDKTTYCNGDDQPSITIVDEEGNRTDFYCDSSEDRIASDSANTAWLTPDNLKCSGMIFNCNLSDRGDPLINFSFTLSYPSNIQQTTFSGKVYFID
jgi:prepilin-type N-terminal cleavage/methylation domain-containing protein